MTSIHAKQILEALAEGKAVRWDSEPENHYYKIIGNEVVDQNGDSCTLVFRSLITAKIYQEPKKKKEVYQWRIWETNCWYIRPYLLTKEEMKNTSNNFSKYEIHAGPFEVEE